MVADLFHDFIVLHVRMKEKGGGHFDPVIIQVILKGDAIGFPEQLSQISAVYVIILAQLLQSQVFRIMFPDVLLHLPENAAAYRFPPDLGTLFWPSSFRVRFSE